MAFFDDLKSKAQSVAAVAADKAKTYAEIASDKARDVADAAKLNAAIASEKKDLEKNYRAIGEWFVSEYQGEPPAEIRDVLAAIDANKAKIAELESQKESKKVDETESDPSLRNCPVCGTVASAKFCPECGAPMDN